MSKHKLLLADDSVTIQKVVNLTFADEGIEVISVGDGDSAMEKVAEFAPDLVLADVNMPGLSGYEICERLRQNESTQNIPVILLVGSFEPFDEAEANRVGANDFLTKPFQSIRQLVDKVTELLNSTNGEDASRFEEAPAYSEEKIEAAGQSFADTLEMKSSGKIDLGDAGMDDEMIQADQVKGFAYDETPKYEADEDVSEDLGKTQPMTAQDLREMSFDNEEEDVLEDTPAVLEVADEEYTDEREVIEETPDEENVEVQDSYETPVPTYAEESQFSDEVKFEEDVSETETYPMAVETETPYVGETESEENVLEDFTGESPMADEIAEQEVYNVPEGEEVTQEIEVAPDVPMPDAASVLELDEANLLELPMPEEIAPYTEAKPEQPVEAETVAETTESTEPTETIQTDQSLQNFSLSPEMIEAIAEKVAQKLSSRAVTDVAWEVVPQMADEIIKKLAEERLKE